MRRAFCRVVHGPLALLLAASTLQAAPPRRPSVLAAVRLPFTASAAPAIGDVDGDGLPDIAITVDNIGDKTRATDDPKNVNAVHVFSWRDSALRPRPGWPVKTPDATLGLAMADLNGDAKQEILGACGQETPPGLMQNAGLWLSSRLFVWRGDGKPLPPWTADAVDRTQGLLFGHAYAAPVVAERWDAGRPAILQASQGIWGGTSFERGGLRLWRVDGTVLAQTQSDAPNRPWYVRPGFAMDTPPVLADLNGDGRREIVAATYEGKVYAWDRSGKPLPGWFPAEGATTETRSGALLRGGITATDLDGDGKDEIVAGGYDGALYCWDGRGRLRFRSALPGAKPAAVTSGIAVGRLRRGMAREWNIVAGDADGYVTVWRPDGRILWRARTTPGNPIQAEPAIGDVNADGTQDVVVGGTDGYIRAFDGETGDPLWTVPTFWAPTLDGMRLEGIFGAPALCDLRGNGHLNIVVPTAGRYIADVPSHTWKGFGHVLVLDCGPGTYRKDRLDWPQYRGSANRAGRAG